MAQPIRRGSRFPVSLFEPPALWDPASEVEYLRDRMGRLYNQITPQEPGQSPWQPDIEVDETEEFYLVKAELSGITRARSNCRSTSIASQPDGLPPNQLPATRSHAPRQTERLIGTWPHASSAWLPAAPSRSALAH